MPIGLKRMHITRTVHQPAVMSAPTIQGELVLLAQFYLHDDVGDIAKACRYLRHLAEKP
jgi:hypothetical protein